MSQTGTTVLGNVQTGCRKLEPLGSPEVVKESSVRELGQLDFLFFFLQERSEIKEIHLQNTLETHYAL